MRLSRLQGVPTEHFTDAAGNKATVGIMIENGIITNLLTGAPAYMSKQFKKGDRQALSVYLSTFKHTARLGVGS